MTYDDFKKMAVDAGLANFWLDKETMPRADMFIIGKDFLPRLHAALAAAAAPQQASAGMDERAEFEKAMDAARFFPAKLDFSLTKSPSGKRVEYVNTHLESNWNGWQARAALAHPPAPAAPECDACNGKGIEPTEAKNVYRPCNKCRGGLAGDGVTDDSAALQNIVDTVLQQFNCEFKCDGATFHANGAANPITYVPGGALVDLSGWTCYAPGAAPVVALTEGKP